MDRKPVQSSDIRSVGYDEQRSKLEIAFHSGGVYQYFGVPKHEYKSLITAGSVGSYFHQNIKNIYDCQKVG